MGSKPLLDGTLIASLECLPGLAGSQMVVSPFSEMETAVDCLLQEVKGKTRGQIRTC